MHKIETTLATLMKRGEQLAAKRAKAQEALEKATSARQQALLAGDLDDQRSLDKLQAAVDSAQSALTGIDDALAILARQKVEAESALATEREQAERNAAADVLEKQIASIAASAGPWLAQSRIYADALAELSHWHFGCDEMGTFLPSCMGQMETALNFQLAELKAIPGMIRDGRQPIPAEPKAVPPVVVEPPTPTRTLFCMKSVKWRDADGRQRAVQQYDDAELPLTRADRALRIGACDSITDDRRKALKGARGGQHPNVSATDIVNLDEVTDHSGALHQSFDPVAQANITSFDRGRPRSRCRIRRCDDQRRPCSRLWRLVLGYEFSIALSLARPTPR